jgi:FAD/FMN-containing dehydrogenase
MTRELSRQAFLRGALGAATAGALSVACRSTATQGTDVASETSGPTTSRTPARPPDWANLGVQGRVTLPSNPEYAAAKDVFNARFDDSTPAAVVAATTIDDVRKAAAFAAEHGIPVAARSGGHSYVGASAANGAMVIDLRQLPGRIDYDESRGLVTVPAAAQLDSVHVALAPYGRSIPTGSCPSVGAAGLTLGGGLGAAARRWGLTCDALVAASVVLPSGEAVKAAADDHDDLFWALRGGGGGSVGVVTSLTFQTFPVTERDVVTLGFGEGATAQALAGWGEWLPIADRATWGMVNVTVGPGSSGATIVLATEPGDGRSRAGELSAAIGVTPVDTAIRTLSHLDFVRYFEGGADATRPRAFVAGSDVIGDLTRGAAEAIVAATSAWPHSAGAATAVVESLSGAVGDVGTGDTAFPWRRQAACVQWYAEPPSQAAIDSAEAWLTRAHQAVEANSVGGYVNYLEPDTPAARYFGDNLGRLADVRRKYDPDGVMYSGLRY